MVMLVQAVERAPTGVSGLDDVLGGGLPKRGVYSCTEAQVSARRRSEPRLEAGASSKA